MSNAMRPHPHAREKLWKAVGCLVGPEPFGIRMTKAAEALGRIHPDDLAQLPEDVRSKLDAIMVALTKHQPAPGQPDHPTWPYRPRPPKAGDGYAASVRKLGHSQRTQIADNILSSFVTLSGGI